mmetsp:Transcript_22888/g.59734  ORF Transcript_22888/g.59734 Transcript_22888/m.59734 type:complete len:183 (-) Transcript_22888:27-575(-)
MDPHKQATSLVAGLARRIFFHDDAVTNELMVEKIFGGDAAACEQAQERVSKTLKAIAAQDMEVAQMERYLAAQASKKGGVTEHEMTALVKYWKKERSAVHDALVKQSSWNATLTGTSWRLDVLAKAQSVEELSEPSAIMEMKIDQAGGAGADILRYEMSAAQVAEMVEEVDAIEAQIKALTA